MTLKLDSNQFKGISMLIPAALLWSLGGLLIKMIDWNPLAIAGTRSGISALIIYFYMGKPKLKWNKIQVAGAVAYMGTVLLYVVANKMTTAANTILLQFTSPIWVAIFGGWFLGEKTTFRDWIFVIIVIFGISLFFIDQLSPEGFWGNIFALISGISFGWVTLLMRKQKSESPIQSILLGNILTFLITFPFMFSQPPTEYSDWTALLILGIFQLGISYILYSEAIRYVTALSSILITMIEPILNPIWVFIIVGEIPGQWALVGGMIVIGTVTFRGISMIKNGQRRKQKS